MASVLVTGVTGFIGKQITLDLLKAGHSVRGTVRSLSKEAALRKTLEGHGASCQRLSLLELDLNQADGWSDSAKGCDYVMHVASPFPLDQPKDREALVPAAKAGTLRVLDAAREADVKRVILTSSLVAMMYRPNRPKNLTVSEGDWTDAEWSKLSAYQVSKVRAERAAWDWTYQHGWEDRLVSVNPGFVLGPALDQTIGTSLAVVKLMLEGAYPAVPPISFAVVDVRDLSRLHIAAMTSEVAGRRLIGAGDSISMQDMAKLVKKSRPDFAKKVPVRKFPAFVIRIASRFDSSLRSIITDLGVVPHVESEYVTSLTGVSFRPASESVVDAAASLVQYGVVTPPSGS
ncbi:MAG: NAD-dependent epimerase/dehydratase family protein [Rhodothermales bacterium]|nr:NAD-dependent epimerase/dehydratase family protein [Rhodothermales bacterium]